MRSSLLYLFSLSCLPLLSCGGETTPPATETAPAVEATNPAPATETAPAVVEKAATTEDGMDALEALEAEVQ